MTIWWGMLFKGEDPCEGLKRLYIEQELSMQCIAEYLGVSPTSVHTKLKECGIETRTCGGSYPRYPKNDLPNLTNVTAKELVAVTGYSLNYCQKLIWRHRHGKSTDSKDS